MKKFGSQLRGQNFPSIITIRPIDLNVSFVFISLGRDHVQVQLQRNTVMWAGMVTKTVVAVNMTSVHTHCRRANANAAYATSSSLRDPIAIVMHDFADACKD